MHESPHWHRMEPINQNFSMWMKLLWICLHQRFWSISSKAKASLQPPVPGGSLRNVPNCCSWRWMWSAARVRPEQLNASLGLALSLGKWRSSAKFLNPEWDTVFDFLWEIVSVNELAERKSCETGGGPPKMQENVKGGALCSNCTLPYISLGTLGEPD